MNDSRILLLAVALLLVASLFLVLPLLTSSPPAAHAQGVLKGAVFGPDGGGVSGIRAAVQPAGRSQAHLVKTDNEGHIRLEDMPAGEYSVGFLPQKQWPAGYFGPIHVREGGTSFDEIHLQRTYSTPADSWSQWHVEFAQSFIARGDSLATVTIQAWSHDARVRVTLHQGGTEGPQIGPARVTGRRFGGDGRATVLWADNEAPTVAGETYTLRLTSADHEPWAIGFAGQGDVYADGHAWMDGTPYPESDLGIWITESNEDFIPEYALDHGYETVMSNSFGQSFIARGNNILMAHLPVGGIDGGPLYLRFSVHEGGPWGRQIGPSKSVRVEENYNVNWMPGEVPVIPGEVYYLHVERFGGATFLAYNRRDTYRKGQAYLNNQARPELDLAAQIYGTRNSSLPDTAPESWRPVELANPSFERGLQGWTRTDENVGHVVESEAGIDAPSGNNMFGWTNRGTGEGTRLRIVQEVSVDPQKTYRLRGKIHTNHKGGRSSDLKIRLLVQRAGAADYENDEQLATSQWFATEGEWVDGSVRFRSLGDTILVGFDMEQRWNLEENNLYVDDLRLEIREREE